MTNLFTRLLKAAYTRSPRDNVRSALRRLGPSRTVAAITVSTSGAPPSLASATSTGPRRGSATAGPAPEVAEQNSLIPDLTTQPVFAHLATARLGNTKRPVVLLGSPSEVSSLNAALAQRGWLVTVQKWDWGDPVESTEGTSNVLWLICKVPVMDEHWREHHRLRQRLGASLANIYELILPLTLLAKAHELLPYHKNRSLEGKAELYLGDRYFGPLQELDAKYPIAGKRIIEFGPFEGYQTAGLHQLGAASVLAVEARPDNALKVLAMTYGLGWDNVSLVLDDFHNANDLNYGRFDLAFAHGVYYHSTVPFLFLENLLSLSDNVFLGGFCATDGLPDRPWELLVYKGERYRVKTHSEGQDFTAGVNLRGYYFHKLDLMRFFQARGYSVEVISDDDSQVTAGNYLRFLARKAP